MGNSFMLDLKYAFRTLKGTPLFTVVAVLTLALGIGATSAVFSVVESVILRPLPFPAADQLVHVLRNDDPEQSKTLDWLDFRDYREQATGFTGMQ